MPHYRSMATKALYWQPRIAEIAALVEDERDIHQAFTVILTTHKGADPHRPGFGSDIWQYLDKPLTQAIPLIVRETFAALTAWEPRASIRGVRAEPVLDESEKQRAARLLVRVDWLWAGTSQPGGPAEIAL